MENKQRPHDEAIVSFFDQELNWWTDVYHEDLPKGFFSFEMRRRLELVGNLLSAQILARDNPDVLECGCGPGDILKLIAPLPCTLTGLDLNQRYLELAAEKVPGATLVDGSIEQLPFPDASFDIVYAVGVLQYLNDDHQAIKEMNRVTREGGVLLISIPNYWMMHLLLDPYYMFRPILNLINHEKKETTATFDATMIRRYTMSQLKCLFDQYDMQVIDTMSTSYGPFKIWRRELLPVSCSMRISEAFRNLSQLKICNRLKHVGNHWIITLRKRSFPPRAKETHGGVTQTV